MPNDRPLPDIFTEPYDSIKAGNLGGIDTTYTITYKILLNCALSSFQPSLDFSVGFDLTRGYHAAM
jgi:hypothetical protein